MKLSLTRRAIFARTSLGAAALLGGAAAAQEGAQPAQPRRERPAPLDPAKVQEFVRVAHRDLDRVKELLAETPGLLNATWDWGGGDFESALGAASHTGRREIALFLLEKGARLDLFAAAMLGDLEVVQAALKARPDLLHSKGPHGIPLVVHARQGGEEAKKVTEYLEELLPPQEKQAG